MMDELKKLAESVDEAFYDNQVEWQVYLTHLSKTAAELSYLASAISSTKLPDDVEPIQKRLVQVAQGLVMDAGRRTFDQWAGDGDMPDTVKNGFDGLLSKVGELQKAANRGADIHPLHSKEVREAVWNLTGGRCAYCDGQLEPYGQNGSAFVVEHVVPTSAGGPDNLANYVPACKTCNSSKNASHVLEFVQRQFPARKPVAKPALVVVPVATPDEGVA